MISRSGDLVEEGILSDHYHTTMSTIAGLRETPDLGKCGGGVITNVYRSIVDHGCKMLDPNKGGEASCRVWMHVANLR